MPNIFDYNPQNIHPFPYWKWNKVLPAVYDDSLSQYEILCKLLCVVNNIISSTNSTGEQVEQLTQLVQQLIDGEFPSGLVQYVNDMVAAAMADDIAAINSTIEAIQDDIDTLFDSVAELQSAHRNEIWVVIGDSFSDENLNTYITNDVTVWPAIIRRNGVGIKNYSASGAGYVHSTGTTFPIQAINASNDTSYNHSLVTRVIVYGFINDVSSEENTTTLVSNVRTMCNTLRESFPYADIQIYPNWYYVPLTLERQVYFNMLQLACAQSHVSYHQESSYLLLNYKPSDVTLDNLHPNQLGQNIIASYFVDGVPSYSGRINGPLSLTGINTFDSIITTVSGANVASSSFGVNESGYDGFDFHVRTDMNSATISGLTVGMTSPVIIGLHFNDDLPVFWSNNIIIPVTVHGNVSNGYRASWTGYIQGRNLYVYATPINEGGYGLSQLTFNFAIDAYFRVR